jgi:hypothetical protein
MDTGLNEDGMRTVVCEYDGELIEVVVGTADHHSDEPDYSGPPAPPKENELARVEALQSLGVDYISTEPSLDFICKVCIHDKKGNRNWSGAGF